MREKPRDPFEQIGPTMVKLVCRFLASRGHEDAWEDVVQDAIEKSMRKWRTFRGIGREDKPVQRSTWVIRIALNLAKNKAIQTWRRAKHETSLAALIGDEDEDDDRTLLDVLVIGCRDTTSDEIVCAQLREAVVGIGRVRRTGYKRLQDLHYPFFGALERAQIAVIITLRVAGFSGAGFGFTGGKTIFGRFLSGVADAGPVKFFVGLFGQAGRFKQVK